MAQRKNVVLGTKSLKQKQQLVKAFVENRGDTLLEKFEKYLIKLKIKCGTCKKDFEINWKSYYDKHGCQKCGQKKANKTNSIPFHKTKKEIEEKHPNITVIKISDKHKSKKKSCNVLMEMKCNKCDNIFKSTRFRMLHTIKPCGTCVRRYGSQGKQRIKKILKKLFNKGKILWYKDEVRLSKYFTKDPICRHKKELIYDFMVQCPNHEMFLIEFDGGYHFSKKSHTTKKNAWNIQKYCDVKKNLHCLNQTIPLLRIHYDDVGDSKSYILHIIDLVKKSKVDDSYIYYSDPKKYKKMTNRMKKSKYLMKKIFK